MLAGAPILYSMNYLELEPQFECQYASGSDWVKNCTSKMICNQQDFGILLYRIDFTNKGSIRNWTEQYGILCATPI